MPISPTDRTRIAHDPDALDAIMAELVTQGRGWVNVMPEIPEEVEVPATPNALAIFSKRGPVVPMGTWTAPTTTRKGAVEPTDLGLQHGTAKQAKRVLDGTAGSIPDTWRVLADNPRRGIVVRPPADVSLHDQARWLLDALAVLCIPPQTGNFLVYRFLP